MSVQEDVRMIRERRHSEKERRDGEVGGTGGEVE